MNPLTQPTFSIRSLTPEDQSWLKPYIIDHWGAAEVVVHNTIHQPVSLPGFVAEGEENLKGVVTFLIKEGDCEIVTLNCEPSRRGLGSALLKMVEETASSLGCNRCWLVTTNDNLDGLRFYQRRGYRMAAIYYGGVSASRQVKPAIPLVGDYGIQLQDEIVLEKNLGTDPAAPSAITGDRE